MKLLQSHTEKESKIDETFCQLARLTGEAQTGGKQPLAAFAVSSLKTKDGPEAGEAGVCLRGDELS
ncbi:MAG: hypothetical protein ACYTDT_13455 [Planctomycetota bacterium]|jgi:hypothetical protein